MSKRVDLDRAGSAPTRDATARLVAVFFLLAFGYVLGQAAGYALFVERFGAADLPIALLMTPVVGLVLTTLSLRAGRRVGLSRLLLAQVVAMVALAAAVRFGLFAAQSTVLRFLLPTWDAGINNLSNLVVWSAASRLFDVREAKRLGPIIAGGRSAALIVGGAATPAIVAAVGTRNLYAVQATVFAAALLVLATLVRRRGADLDRATSQPSTGRRRGGFAARDRRYVIGVFTAVLLSMTAYVLIRTVFLDRGAAALPDPADYAGRIGVVSSIQGAVTLIAGVLLGGRFLRRFGVLGGVMALPLVAMAAYVPFVALNLSLDTQLLIASVAYVSASAAMYGVRTPTMQVLYQPLPDADRARAVSIGEGIVEPTALGLAALILLLVNHATSWGAQGMGMAIVAVAIGLIAAGVAVARRYGPALERALANRWLRRGTALLTDSASKRWLIDTAMRGDIEEVAAVVGLLDPEDTETTALVEHLTANGNPEVRVFALRWLLDTRRPVPDDVARRSATAASSPVERALAARLGARSGDVGAATVALADGDAEVRVAALVGLLEAESEAATRLADQRLADWIVGPPVRRTEAAEALRSAGAARHELAVVDLLADTDPAVRAAALGAAERLGAPRFVEPLLVLVRSGDRAMMAGACAALGAIGEPALAAIELELGRTNDRTAPRSLARAIGKVHGPTAEASLQRLLAHDDAHVRARAADELRHRDVRLEPGEVDALVRTELERIEGVVAARASAPLRAGASADSVEVLTISLDESRASSRRQVLRLLALGRGATVSDDVINGLDSGDQRRRAYALEVLDRTGPSPLMAAVMPIIDPRAGAVPAGSLRSDGDALATFATGPDPWLAKIARHVHEQTNSLMDDGDGGAMASTIERVVLLRRLEAFAELPTEVLASIAELLVEVALADGETLFEEGETGTSLYVVADGAIRIHRGSIEVDILRRHDVFGELALLDSEPRSASATAEGASTVLRLDAEPFFELVGDHPEVYRGILRKLVRRVRALTLMIDSGSS